MCIRRVREYFRDVGTTNAFSGRRHLVANTIIAKRLSSGFRSKLIASYSPTVATARRRLFRCCHDCSVKKIKKISKSIGQVFSGNDTRVRRLPEYYSPNVAADLRCTKTFLQIGVLKRHRNTRNNFAELLIVIKKKKNELN